MESSIFDFSKKPMGLEIKDIAEIRPGTHSIGFVRTNSTDKQGEVHIFNSNFDLL